MGTRYSSQSATGYNASPPSDDGTAVSTNEVKWSFIKTKLGDPVKDLADNINTALGTHFNEEVVDKAIAFTTTAAEHKKTINVTAAATISLGDASTMAAGYIVTVKNSHTAAITVDLATGADTLDGTAAGSISLAPDGAMTFVTTSGADGYLQQLGSIANILNESADHAATPTAGKGEYWVRDDAPNTAMFTDDEGNDFQISPTPVVSGHIRAGNMQLVDGSATSSTVSKTGPSTAFQTVGPTGSGATNIWDALDSVPASAGAIIATCDTVLVASTADSASVIAYAAVNGVTAVDNAIVLAYNLHEGASGDEQHMTNTVFIPIDSNGVFQFKHVRTGSLTTATSTLRYMGFIAG